MEAHPHIEFRDTRAPSLDVSGADDWGDLSPPQMRQLLSLIWNVNRGLNLDNVLEELYRAISQIIPCDRMGLALIDAQNNTAVSRWVKSNRPVLLKEGYQASLSGSTLQDILETHQVRIIGDLEQYAREHPHSNSTHLLLHEQMRSSLTCPLFAAGEPIGFLFFTSTRPFAYNDAELLFYQHIAAQVAVMIEKARLYSELAQYTAAIEKVNETVRKDLELAAQLQRTFIPEHPPSIPGLDMALLYEPLAAVGGDLVELMPMDEGRLLIFMADAMGHGVPAALAMAVVKATFFAILREAPLDPSAILQKLNSALPPLLQSHFAAGLAMVVDPRQGLISSARAALPPPVIINGTTGESRALCDGGLPLSIDDREPYHTTTVPFHKDDILILATDGVIETLNAAGDEYGLEQLVRAAESCSRTSAKDCLKAIISDLVRHRASGPTADDMSLVVVRRNSESPA